MTDFGLLLKTLRTNAGLTQKELASLIHVSDKVISKWERNESYPDIILLRNLSHTLNISCDDLLHPTDTLSKMHLTTTEYNSEFYNDIEINESTSNETDAEDTLQPSKDSIFTFKKTLLVCIPLLILVLIGGIIGFTAHQHSLAASTSYILADTRSNLDTPNGSAYELIFYIDSKSDRAELLERSDSVAEEWRAGSYNDSTENVLIVSIYLSGTNIEDWNSAYFRATYFRDSLSE